MFAEIQNKHITVPSSINNPYPTIYLPEQLHKFYKIVPVRDLRNLTLVFPVPVNDDEKAYLVKANRYWSHLIGHEGEGSIFVFLKKRGWVNALSAGHMSKFTGNFLFSITISLTEEGKYYFAQELANIIVGEEHVEEIVHIVFQYLYFMRKNGPQQWVFEECRDLGLCEFRFMEKINPAECVSNLAKNLQKYRPEHVISGSHLWFKYDLASITNFLSYLVVNDLLSLTLTVLSLII